MKNQEIRILLDDKETILVVENQSQLIEKLKTEKINSIRFYGDLPNLKTKDQTTELNFAHVDVVLVPGTKNLKIFASRLESRRNPELIFATILESPYLNIDGRISVDLISVFFERFEDMTKEEPNMFERGKLGIFMTWVEYILGKSDDLDFW